LQELEATSGKLLRIIWLIAWRGSIGGLVCGGVIGFVVGFIMGLAGSPHEYIRPVTGVAGFIAGAIWWFVVIKMALEKQYGDFRIALIAR
jgi:hypothetical protein